MYNVKGPSKFVAKTRRGLVQSLEVKSQKSKLSVKEQNNNNMTNENSNSINGPKPIFKSTPRKVYNPTRNISSPISIDSNPPFLPQHQEIVNFVTESWNCVCSELKEATQSSEDSSSPISCYYEDEPAKELLEFEPFDLELWWGQRFFTYITNSANLNS